MTTRKPKVVAYARTGALDRILPTPWKLPIVSDWSPMYSDALIRLSDYEKLQAECEKLRSIISDIKDWDCDVSGGFLSIPVGLRRRIQNALADHRKQGGSND